MMTSNRKLLLTALFSVVLLYCFSQSAAISIYDCCLGYTKRIIPPKFLQGFIRQHANEACDIDAVIFITKRNKEVCADPKQRWVKEAMHVLSKPDRKM